ncbi:BglG family transcription antiterminator [Paenibacillus sp. GCM10012307]|uniref:BglG family transcription antiterminator n=1 Tax=Paenibacillus roseus TaxID=2798579 RepID=A0A934J8R2_9BACL|nr:BglG family transcription antiterminator [Paenibacillus roseus]MBJ6363889.1 BglG family transcription antiterminator [Paenibacillus roseus]
MKVTNRQRQLLDLLLNSKEEITAADIAAAINVSARTVHRELPELELLLEKYGIELQRKSGIGIQVSGQPAQLDMLKQELSRMNYTEYTAEERRIFILCMLLESVEPAKLFALAHNLHVTVATMSYDLDELEKGIIKYDLQLVRRRGYGVLLEGSEHVKRELLLTLARQYIDNSDLFGSSLRSQEQPVISLMLDQIGKSNLLQLEQALWELEQKHPLELTDQAYTKLLLQLSIALRRIHDGHLIAPSDESPDACLRPEIASLLRQLEEEFAIKLPASEQRYISGLIRQYSEEESGYELLPHGDLDVLEKTVQLIGFMDRHYDAAFHRDYSLRDGLLRHLVPALMRIREGSEIRNPLLPQIKADYSALFDRVRQGADEVFPELKIPDEEVGFLVMHFGAALERGTQPVPPVRAIVVCSSGIGSSKLLAVRLERELPEVVIVGNVPWYEAARIPENEYDVIISTIDLPLQPDKYFKISPLLTDNEASQLRRFLQHWFLYAQQRTQNEQLAVKNAPSQRLKQLKACLDEICFLLERFHLYKLPDTEGLDVGQVLFDACKLAAASGAINDIDAVVRQLLEREQQGSEIVTDTGLALFHARSKDVLQPLVVMFQLKQPMLLQAHSVRPASYMMLMLGPLALGKESLEVLSEISTLLLLPELPDVLATGNELAIKDFMANALLGYFYTKTEAEMTW